MRNDAGRPVYRQAAAKPSPLPKAALGVAAIAVAAAVALALSGAFGGADAEGVDKHAEAFGGTGFDSGVAEPEAARTVTLSFAGDCTLGTDENFDRTRNFNATYDSVGDPSYFLANVAPLFREDDITVVNMEGTLTDSTSRLNKKFAFKGPAEYASILPAGDVQVAAFANNHDADYGPQSYDDTIAALEAQGITVASEDKIAYATANGVKVAVVAIYELDDHREREPDVKQYIAAAREEGAELVVVFFHWGNEREYAPDDNQIYMGHMAVDAGADMVVGSHPHVLQGYEKYNGRYIFYSMGNFCYGGHSNPADKDSVVVQKTFTLEGGEVRLDDDIKVVPCSISSSQSRNNYQPTPAEGAELERMLAKWDELNANVQDALAAYEG